MAHNESELGVITKAKELCKYNHRYNHRDGSLIDRKHEIFRIILMIERAIGENTFFDIDLNNVNI